MFKTNFYIVIITTRDKFNRPIKKQCFRQVSGWGELFEAPDGSPVSLRFDRRTPNGWRITEEGTGYAVSRDYYSTRAEAVRSLTPEFLQKIADRVKCPEMLRAAETLAAFILAQKTPIDNAAAGKYNKAKE